MYATYVHITFWFNIKILKNITNWTKYFNTSKKTFPFRETLRLEFLLFWSFLSFPNLFESIKVNFKKSQEIFCFWKVFLILIKYKESRLSMQIITPVCNDFRNSLFPVTSVYYKTQKTLVQVVHMRKDNLNGTRTHI